MIFEGFLGLLAVCTYISVGVRTARFLVACGYGEMCNKREIGPLAFFGGVFWPVLLPTVAIYNAPTLVVKGFKGLGRLKKPEAQEIIPGVESPVSILEGLLSCRILQHPDGFSSGYDSFNWESADETVKVVTNNLSSSGRIYEVKASILGKPSVALSPDGQVATALKKVLLLKAEKQENERRFNQEKAALDAVECLLLSPVKE